MPHGKAVKVETCTTLRALLGMYNEAVREVKSLSDCSSLLRCADIAKEIIYITTMAISHLL